MYFQRAYIVFLLLLNTIVGALDSKAQQTYTISNYTVNDGLAQSTIYSICQDKRGFLWFATYGGGVSRFDGVNFETITTNDSLLSNKIYCITEDSKGNIWIGTRGGLSIYDGFELKNYTVSNGLSSNNIRFIKQGNGNDVWIATSDAGVMKYDGETFLKYSSINGLLSNDVYGIEVQANGNVLFATREGVSEFDGKRFTVFDDGNSHVNKYIRCILEVNDNEVLYGSYGGGVCNVKNNKHTCIELKDDANNIMSIIQSTNGNIWIGTFGDGLFCINKDTILNFNMENSTIQSNSILSVFEDNNGAIWAGTYQGGVSKISESTFFSLTKKDGLIDPSIETLFDYNNSIYMASMSGGLSTYKDSKINYYNSSEERKKSRITSFMVDADSTFWMGTDGAGIYSFVGEKIKNYSRKSLNFPSNQVFSMFQSSDKSYWFGTYGDGIIRMKDGKIKKYNKNYVRGLKSDQIYDIEEGKNGEIWFATNGGGLTKFDGVNFSSYTKDDGLLSNDFVSIKKDMFDNLWFASNGGGVVKFDGENFKTFSKKDGLISDNINLILFDNANNLWVGTEKGINKIVFELKDTLNKVEYLINSIRHYGLEDGLVGLETNRGAALKDEKGNLWFGTVKGISIYNPKADKFNTISPNVYIKNIKLKDEYVDWNLYADSVSQWNNLPINLSLKYNQNDLTFEFVGINLNVPHGVDYKYKLDGLNDEWHHSTNNYVNYSNLPFGDYNFKIYAANEDGIWQSEPTVFTFTISKPFWLERYFIALLLLFVIIIIVYYVKSREKLIRKRNLMLEKIVNDRTIELKKEKEKIEKVNIVVAKKNEQILDSIQYAKKIQMAILPPDELVREKLPDYCIFYEAKDIVSGDFYWMSEEGEEVFFAAVDCTGHGVPGAFMSIVGYRMLELIINGYHITEPAEALDELHMQVLETLHKQKGAAKDISDGMDIALCSWNKETRILKYAGAHNPLYLIRNGELIEYASDYRPIGMSMLKEFKRFKQHSINIEKNDIVYIFTDGFADQFGGETYRKYYYQTFQDFLLSIANEPMGKQQELLKEEFYRWKGDYGQIDDVLVFGVKF